ncbi:VanZ family protein, partial [Streptomyces albidoflavus]|uniref:VanZ family protein n=1 Tax=Streptomyces albidoflavus TaxID=1886 RepID=UPI0033B155E7
MTTRAHDPRPRRPGWVRAVVRALIVMVAFVAMVVFSIVLAQVTLTPSPASTDLIHANLTPGSSLRSYAEDYTFLAALKQAGGNLLLGFPFGLLLPVLVARRMRLLRVVGLTAVVMVLVELAQGSVVEGRAFDIDDVILNTSGALLAYLLLGRRIGRRYHRLADTADDRAAARPAPGAPRQDLQQVGDPGHPFPVVAHLAAAVGHRPHHESGWVPLPPEIHRVRTAPLWSAEEDGATYGRR